ncbi:hypothetical protein SLEP1_g41963 [Rubroshorea leprosula]|uniref:glucan endo-1,3-beta-D-glucosidase n=1 Tax=Rubroshorea leprosula TaxID=152421 RepID=A0AAV5L962_9ROSI|nr:hypothetical protein SLEP1_g41963 [Rubroshorea leprosula]
MQKPFGACNSWARPKNLGHHAAQHGGSRLGFLADTGAPFMINAYPYFAYKENPSAVDLEYALLGNATRIHDPKGYIYNNMLDAQIDAIRSAINALGFGNQTIEITVSESGWPSKGAPGDSTATLDNAKKYNTRIPTGNKIPSKSSAFSTQCISKRLQVAEFFGLRSSSCVIYATNARGTSFSEVVAAQLTPKVDCLLQPFNLF